jgi:hypothetical protein
MRDMPLRLSERGLQALRDIESEGLQAACGDEGRSMYRVRKLHDLLS